MIRRKLTLKRIDPWSVLKFGFVVNLAVLFVALLGLFILWLVIQRLGLIDRACDSLGNLLLDLDDCGVNGGPLFRTLLFVGLLSAVAQTGIMVFGAFLYNLIADLTGGLGFTFLDESGDLQMTTSRRSAVTTGAGAGSSGTAAKDRSSSDDGDEQASGTPARSGAGTTSGQSPGGTEQEQPQWSASSRPGGAGSPRGPSWSGGPGASSPPTAPGTGSTSSSTTRTGGDDPIFGNREDTDRQG